MGTCPTLPAAQVCLTLDESLLNAAFPFYILVAPSGRIMSTGPSLDKIAALANLRGRALFDVFSLASLGPLSCYDDLKLKLGKKVRASFRNEPDLELTGLVICETQDAETGILIDFSPNLETLCGPHMEHHSKRDFRQNDLSTDIRYVVEMQRSVVQQAAHMNRELSDAKTHLGRLRDEHDILNLLVADTLQHAKSALTYRENKENGDWQVNRVGYDPGSLISKFMRFQCPNLQSFLEKIAAEHPQDVSIVPIEAAKDFPETYFLELASGATWSLTVVEMQADRYALLWSEITHQKNVEHRNHRAQKLEAIGVLASGIAHDFNNILAIITNGLETLANTQETAENKKIIAEMMATVERAQIIVGQLLAFRGNQAPGAAACKLSEALRSLETIVSSSLSPTHMLSIEPGEKDVWLSADPNLLITALVNLVINARDAQPQGGEIRLRHFTLPDENAVENKLPPDHKYHTIDVIDQGNGIPDSIRDRICEPFFSTKPPQQGSGLGLSMVYGFARSNNGDLAFTNNQPKGSVVSIVLKELTSDQAAAIPTGHNVIGVSTSQASIKTNEDRHIVLVEDEQALRKLIKVFLLKQGVSVQDYDSVSSVAENLDQIRNLPNYTILTDYCLPDGTGTDVLRLLGNEQGQIQQFIMSGNLTNIDLGDLVTHTQVIKKPFKLKDLPQLLGFDDIIPEDHASAETKRW